MLRVAKHRLEGATSLMVRLWRPGYHMDIAWFVATLMPRCPEESFQDTSYGGWPVLLFTILNQENFWEAILDTNATDVEHPI